MTMIGEHLRATFAPLRKRQTFGYDVRKSVTHVGNVDDLLETIDSVGAAKRVLLDHRNPIGRYAIWKSSPRAIELSVR